MFGFVANALVTPAIARRLARVIPNPFVRTLAIAAVGYGVNQVVSRATNRPVSSGPRPDGRRPAYLPSA